MLDLTALSWTLLAVAAVIVGISKTAIPGAGSVAIAIFAAVLPARESTGAILPLLIVADVFAVWSYRRDANWRALLRLIPAVVVGMALGLLFLALANDTVARIVIGLILLSVIAFTLGRRWLGRRAAEAGPVASAAYGTLGGFTTMVANAAGPVMSMYFIAKKFSVKEFLGTAAWFFAIVNLSKVPFSIGLGFITPSSLLMNLVLAPLAIAGAVLGLWLAKKLDQVLFERLVILFTLIGAAYLLWPR